MSKNVCPDEKNSKGKKYKLSNHCFSEANKFKNWSFKNVFFKRTETQRKEIQFSKHCSIRWTKTQNMLFKRIENSISWPKPI